MTSIGICVLVHGNFHETKFFFENLLNSTNIKFRLYVFDFGNEDNRTTEYVKQLCTDTKGYYRGVDKAMNRTNIYNQFIQVVSEQCFCFVPINAIVSKNWLEELDSNYKSIQESGCIGVKHSKDETYLTGALYHTPHKEEDEMKTVWTNKHQVIDSIMFFNRDRLSLIGSFDERSTATGFEMHEFSFRFLGNGFKNYFVKKASYIKLPVNDPILFPILTKSAAAEFKTQIDLMFKVRQFKK